MLVLGAVLATGCAPRQTLQPEAGTAGLRWVEGPTPHVRTLLAEPVSLGTVPTPGHQPVELRVGAFFARWTTDGGPVDQLALMVELRGEGALALLGGSRRLLLEMDGELFAGRAGSSENSFRVHSVDGRPCATVVIPVTPYDLARLSGAQDVRGQVGEGAPFQFPAPERTRLARILDSLPEGAPAGLPARPLLRRGAEAP